MSRTLPVCAPIDKGKLCGPVFQPAIDKLRWEQGDLPDEMALRIVEVLDGRGQTSGSLFNTERNDFLAE